jgi:hypothetical protein
VALTTCSECGGQLSSSAKICPHCGNPVAQKRAQKGCLVFLGIFGGMILLAIVAGSEKNGAPTPKAAAPMPILVQPWPPIDPDEEITKVEFTSALAKRLAGFHTIEDLQKALGSKGKITERGKDPGRPAASYHWMSQPRGGRLGGFVMATESADGSIGVGFLSNDVGQIVINNNGSFICDKCNPPIDIER